MVHRHPIMQGAFIRLATSLLVVQGLAPSALAQVTTEAPAPQDTETPAILPLDLAWYAPADACPDENAVRAEVMGLVGNATEGSRHLSARVAIQRDGNGWSLFLSTNIDGVVGERTLAGDSCQSLAEAAALMLALALNPDLVTKPHAPSPVPDPPSAPVIERTLSLEESTASTWWKVGALAGLQAGVLDELSLIFGLSLELGRGHFSLRLMPSVAPPQNVYVDSDLGLGGRLWLATLTSLACGTTAAGPFSVSPCIGAEVTRLQGRGLGVLHPRDTVAYWTSADLGLFIGLPMGRHVSIEVGTLGLLPFNRPKVFLDEIGTVSRPATLAFRVLGALAWRF